MIKMSNNFKSFRSFKICYYLQLKFPNNNITHGFPKNWWILVQNIRLIAHFWKHFSSIRKHLPFLHYFIKINAFQTLGKKLNYLKKIFVQQCTLIDNASEIPATLNIKTTKTLSSIQVAWAEFAKLIEDLGPNKAHGHNMISIRILKSCGDSVLPPLQLIFKSYLEIGTFSSE